MKKLKLLLPSIFFFIIFTTGLVTLIVPFNFENFCYSKVKATSDSLNSSSKSFDVTFTIENNSNKTLEDVTVFVKYNLKKENSIVEEAKEIFVYNLNKGLNEITFAHIEENSLSEFSGLKLVELKLNNKKFVTVYEKSFIVGPNWYFLGLLIIGFFGCSICLSVYIYKRKFESENETQAETTLFNKRLKNALSNLSKKGNKNNNNITTCKQCNCKYKKENTRCPNCGAPPKPSN